MGTLTRKLARVFAVAMFLAIVSLIALSIYAAEVTASPLTDSEPVAARIAQAVWYHVDNDTYGEIVHSLSLHNSDKAATVMVHVAHRECDQVLYEDYSCGAAYK